MLNIMLTVFLNSMLHPCPLCFLAENELKVVEESLI